MKKKKENNNNKEFAYKQNKSFKYIFEFLFSNNVCILFSFAMILQTSCNVKPPITKLGKFDCLNGFLLFTVGQLNQNSVVHSNVITSHSLFEVQTFTKEEGMFQ